MLAAAHGVISQLHMLRISKSVSWVLRIPVLSVSCQEAMTLVIKPCALIPWFGAHVLYPCSWDALFICHMVLIAQCGKVLRLPLRSYCLRWSDISIPIWHYHTVPPHECQRHQNSTPLQGSIWPNWRPHLPQILGLNINNWSVPYSMQHWELDPT